MSQCPSPRWTRNTATGGKTLVREPVDNVVRGSRAMPECSGLAASELIVRRLRAGEEWMRTFSSALWIEDRARSADLVLIDNPPHAETEAQNRGARRGARIDPGSALAARSVGDRG
jgi:hypothetical protein